MPANASTQHSLSQAEIDAGLTRALNNLAAAPVFTDPFLFAPLEHPFGSQLYDHIIAHLPDDNFYDWGRFTTAQEGARGVATLNRVSLANLPADKRVLWTRIADWMESDAFARTLLGKFDTVLTKRFAEPDTDRRFFAEVKLVRDRANYALQPHTDQSDRVATVMFYLPGDDSIRAHGTSVYRPRREGLTCDGSRRHEFEDFDLVVTAPFARDSGLAFCRSDTSFHGVKPIGSDPIQRDFLTFSIRERRRNLVADAKQWVRTLRGDPQMVRVDTQYA